jgi:hypothetical protein
MEACLGKMGAMDLQANSEEIESEEEHEDVLNEEAAVETFGVLKERYRDRCLTVRRCGQLKKRTQGSGGSRRSSPPPAEG